MSQPRRQMRIILVGTNGTGKSTEADKYIKALPPTKKSLIVTPDDSEPLWFKYPTIEEHHLPGINLLKERNTKIMFTSPKLFTQVLTHVHDGILILDDARSYSSSRDEHLRNVFIRSRQNNLDLIFICHGLSEIPPSVLTFTTHIVLYNTTDSWQRLKGNLVNPGKFEEYVNRVRLRANDHKPKCIIHKDREGICNCGAAHYHETINTKIDLI